MLRNILVFSILGKGSVNIPVQTKPEESKGDRGATSAG